jgi:hypothetical protein
MSVETLASKYFEAIVELLNFLTKEGNTEKMDRVTAFVLKKRENNSM